jgi:signal transduction histidine kinase
MDTKRDFRNILISPDRQLRMIALVTFVCGMTYLASVYYIIKHLISELAMASSAIGSQMDFQDKMIMAIQHSMFSIGVVGVVLIVLLAVGLLILSHRIYGPLVPIKRFIQQIREGDYAARVSIRDEDELHDLVVELNEMAVTLEKRHIL